MGQQTTGGKTVGAVERLLEILEFLQEQDGARVTEIADQLDYAPSSAHSHLNTLLDQDYVVKEGQEYYLGLKFLDFGYYTQNRKQEYVHIKPYVEELARETGEVGSFIVEEHGMGVFVFRELGEKAPMTSSAVGKRYYLHVMSAGKAILAHLPKQDVETILEKHGLPQRTRLSITDEEELYRELETVRETGFAVNNGENIKGLRAIGVPILDGNEDIIGALSVSGPANRLKGEWFENEIPDLLLGTANEIELNLTYSE